MERSPRDKPDLSKSRDVLSAARTIPARQAGSHHTDGFQLIICLLLCQ